MWPGLRRALLLVWERAAVHCGCRARWALTCQAPASHSEQVEKAALDPPAGHPHLRRFWHSPEQVQVSHFTCHSPHWPLPFSPCHMPRRGWDPGAIGQIVASFLPPALRQAGPPPIRTLHLTQDRDRSETALGRLPFLTSQPPASSGLLLSSAFPLTLP